ncbi:hypothetical protein CGH27_27160, partial [Vibrio parahaemolyticus]
KSTAFDRDTAAAIHRDSRSATNKIFLFIYVAGRDRNDRLADLRKKHLRRCVYMIYRLNLVLNEKAPFGAYYI